MRKQMRQWSTQGSAAESAAVERPDTPRRCPRLWYFLGKL
jgi:hypothetical protein